MAESSQKEVVLADVERLVIDGAGLEDANVAVAHHRAAGTFAGRHVAGWRIQTPVYWETIRMACVAVMLSATAG